MNNDTVQVGDKIEIITDKISFYWKGDIGTVIRVKDKGSLIECDFNGNNNIRVHLHGVWWVDEHYYIIKKEDTFSKGDRVKLVENTVYTDMDLNPHNLGGTITYIKEGSENLYNIKVRWDNGHLNEYKVDDLVLVDKTVTEQTTNNEVATQQIEDAIKLLQLAVKGSELGGLYIRSSDIELVSSCSRKINTDPVQVLSKGSDKVKNDLTQSIEKTEAELQSYKDTMELLSRVYY